MEVVQTDVRGCSSSHLTTVPSGLRRISAESTFVSSTIIDRKRPVEFQIRATLGYRLQGPLLRIEMKSRCPIPRRQFPPPSPRPVGCRAPLPPCFCRADSLADGAAFSLQSRYFGRPTEPSHTS